MKNKIIYTIILLLYFIANISCSKKNSQKHNVNSLTDIMEVIDEIPIKLPIEYSFRYLFDISFNNDFLYLCTSNSTYPVLKIDLKTNNIFRIGRIGNGPDEYSISPRRISAFKNWLMITDGPQAGFVYLFKNSHLINKKFFEPYPIALRVYDVAVLSDNQFLISGAGDSKYYYLIVDSTFSIIHSTPFPPNSTITAAVLGIMWTVQVSPNSDVLLNPIYPDIIHILSFENYEELKEISLHLANFFQVNKNLTMKDFYKAIADPLKLYRKIGKMIWIINNNGTFYGAYLYGKTQQGKIKNKAVLFIYNNQSKSEIEIDTKKLTHFIPDKNKLYYIDTSIENEFQILKIKHISLKLQ